MTHERVFIWMPFSLLLVLVLFQACRGDDGTSQQVFGGVPVKPKNFKWFTAIEELGSFVCSGVLVGSGHVLTAAHCLRNRITSNLQAVVSYYCPQSDNCAARTRQNIFIFEAATDPNDGDIAILTLTSKVSLSGIKFAVPDVLGPTSYRSRLRKKDMLTLVGAGRAGTREGINDRVRRLSLRYQKQKSCKKKLSNKDLVTPNTICSSGMDGHPCLGDSGAGVLVKGKGDLKGRDVLVGIHSFGPRDCTNAVAGLAPLGHFAVSGASAFITQTICESNAAPDWCPSNDNLIDNPKPPAPRPPTPKPPPATPAPVVSPTQNAYPTCSPRTVVYNDALDTSLRKSNPDTSDGAQTVLKTDEGEEVLLKFPSLPRTLPPGTHMNEATLRLYVESSSPGPVFLHRMLTPWTESSTFNSFGDDGVLADDYEAMYDEAVVMTDLPPRGSYVSIHVEADVAAWMIFGDRNEGWIFYNPSTTDGFEFSSSENSIVAYRPELHVNFACGEPSPQTPACGGSVKNTRVFYEDAVDTVIDENNPARGGFLDQVLVVDSVDPKEKQVLIKFPTLPSSLPKGIEVKRAFLWLYAVQESAGPVYLHRMRKSWTASTATWNYFGGNGVQSNDDEANQKETIELRDIPGWDVVSESGTWSKIPVGDDVEAWLVKGDANEGWVLKSHQAVDDGVDFYSTDISDDAHRPELFVTFSC